MYTHGVRSWLLLCVSVGASGVCNGGIACEIARDCSATVTIEKFVKACAQTTPLDCSDDCKAILQEVNFNKLKPNCLNTTTKHALDKGVPLKMICNWRTPCGINTFTGVDCPKPKQSFGNTADVSVVMPGPPGIFTDQKSMDVFTVSIADSLKVMWGDVEVQKKENSRRSLAGLAGTNEVDVIVAVKNAEAGSNVIEDLKNPTFAQSLKAALENAGVNVSSVPSFQPTEVNDPVVEPPMGGYTVPKYTSSKAVITFKSYSMMEEGSKWDANPNSEEGKKYLKGVASLSAMSMIFAVLFMLEYWVFLCFHNCGCCKKICSCCNQKGAWGGEKVARPMLALMFIVTLIVMCTSLVGRNHFQDGLTDFGHILGNTSTIFKGLEDAADKFSVAAQKFEDTAKLAQVVESLPLTTGCQQADPGKLLQEIADAFNESSTTANSFLNGVSEDLDEMNKNVSEDGPNILDALVFASIALFFPWCLCGLIGVALGSNCPRLSDAFLNFVSFLGLIILWLVAIMIAIELAIGVTFADFCNEDPLVAMVNLINEFMGKGEKKTEMMTFYLNCAENKGNAFNPTYEPVLTAQAFAEIIQMQAEGLGDAGLCAATTMEAIHGPGAAAELSIDAFEIVKNKLSCESINPLLVTLTHDAICDSTVSGLLALFNTQVVGGVFLLITLHYASFVRPYMNTKPKDDPKGAKVDPHGNDDSVANAAVESYVDPNAGYAAYDQTTPGGPGEGVEMTGVTSAADTTATTDATADTAAAADTGTADRGRELGF